MKFYCLEEHIAVADPTRFMDAFVATIALKSLGFEAQTLKAGGRPSFDARNF